MITFAAQTSNRVQFLSVSLQVVVHSLFFCCFCCKITKHFRSKLYICYIIFKMGQEKRSFEQANAEQMPPIQQRLYSLMEYFGQSKSEFAQYIGTTLNVLNVYYKRQTLSRVLIDKILTKFPEVSPEWLASGEGPMLLENKKERVDVSFLTDATVERIPMSVPGIPCDSFVKVSGFTFEPIICNGDIIGVRQQKFDTIDPAKYYLIITEEGAPMVKRIVAADEEYIYISTGETQIKPFKLAQANVKGLFRIVYVGRAI